MGPADKLVRSTVRVVAQRGGRSVGTGSALLMQLKVFGPENTNFTLAAITNKHVVRGADLVLLEVAKTAEGSTWTNAAMPDKIIMHPDEDVDLCVVPVHPSTLKSAGDGISFISSNDIWTSEKLSSLSAIESIKMLGYPNGLVDSLNLYPIVRTGVTATPVYADYCGKPEFLIDCACFPGSSGSPIFLFDQGVHISGNSLMLGTSRFGLLGFLYAGPTVTQTGHIVVRPGETAPASMVAVEAMLNLGLCVRAEKLFDLFKPISELDLMTAPPG